MRKPLPLPLLLLLSFLLPATASAREYQIWVGSSAQQTNSASVDAVNAISINQG